MIEILRQSDLTKITHYPKAVAAKITAAGVASRVVIYKAVKPAKRRRGRG